ncbi:hypothetical protein GN330_23355 [Nitratireductor sp. CAU 1489]|uniref:Uncharacterized protein n=1 Tax=Nitratireductor arenosus TaxID=2682096 RepID=A0A844QQ78_9HYPH|nr:hypothetical protein [Nitratireductor arenosus]MVB00189.1 hypothetical protein [Nitratireductor arenosus]
MESAIGFLPYLILVALTIIPSWKLLGRVGMTTAWALLCFLPLGFILVMWIVAYRRWPLAETE